MMIAMKGARLAVLAATVASLSACAGAGTLGSILGSVLGGGAGGGGNQLQGTVQSVDSRNQQINVRQSNGQTISVAYDNRTQVSYQNQNYPVTSLEFGDEIAARVQQTQNGAYYTDLIQVTRSNSNSTSTGGSGSVQTIEGRVRQVDAQNGWFTVTTSNNSLLTVTMPYNSTRSDMTRFQNLRSGDYVRLYGTYVNNSRVELRQFY